MQSLVLCNCDLWNFPLSSKSCKLLYFLSLLSPMKNNPSTHTGKGVLLVSWMCILPFESLKSRQVGEQNRGDLGLFFVSVPPHLSFFCASSPGGLYPMETTHCKLPQKRTGKKEDWQLRCSLGIVLGGLHSHTHPLGLQRKEQELFHLGLTHEHNEKQKLNEKPAALMCSTSIYSMSHTFEDTVRYREHLKCPQILVWPLSLTLTNQSKSYKVERAISVSCPSSK